MLSKRAIGARYEALAAQYLCARGCRLITKNFLARGGEIDLILLEQETIVFVEVKYRTSSDFGHPSELVTFHKQKKVIKTAQRFLQKNPKYALLDARFDVISVLSIKPENEPNFEWVRGAFTT